jgi:protein TIF31
MVARAAKHLLRSILSEADVTMLSPTISHFLNCFLSKSPRVSHTISNASTSSNAKKKKKKKPGNKGKNTSSNLTPDSLWKSLTKLIKDRYQYDVSLRYNSIGYSLEIVLDIV